MAEHRDRIEEEKEREKAREQETDSTSLAVNATYTIVGGVITALVTIGGAAIVGTVTSFKALELTESIAPSIRFLGSSVMTACATILALMLTLLSISSDSLEDADLQNSHYRRLKQISLMCTGALILSLVLLMLVSVPLKEADDLPTGLYTWVYYILVGTSALLAGLFITMILSLYDAIRDVITIFHTNLTTRMRAASGEQENRSR